ncbi:hypothetical protein CONCODRAFT_77185 [Conidiobolus coronatus NRRL 28638]|uniref:Vacuolar ATPase assembly integral membrane protein VMA21 n=1 Tax=Conidiobolus coronatus (strain ATCC 28846 / CBS 209.66 / NRRL 28638) TaxID=796925 RepID=A0A137PFN2_CONC2|nr:hypothetical protein CONCODRAFT_77185 [Conidiobolus coronatus NRRL 28638]|eukprot:KXN73807.1 hypothetical protein CONCODRAFT_77185 [Conidiobolus coronatus NRRL 28638]
MVKNRKNKEANSNTSRPKDEAEVKQIPNTRSEFIKKELDKPKPPKNVVVPVPVIVKILVFSLALIFLPIGSYFYTLDRYFNGNSTYSALLAAGVANVIAIGYVIAAVIEDQSSESSSTESKKNK